MLAAGDAVEGNGMVFGVDMDGEGIGMGGGGRKREVWGGPSLPPLRPMSLILLTM